MNPVLIKNAHIVNEGKIIHGDVLIENKIIGKIAPSVSRKGCKEIDASGKYLFPGVIDDQVHFREPGLTHKADIATESKAAVAGGVTSYMEMPNTLPRAVTHKILEEKYKTASEKSLANYSFYLGASNDNIDEIARTDPHVICGIKVFMGSSTGNMLVDNPIALEKIFSTGRMLIATHCEDESTIRANLAFFRKKYGAHVPVKFHPEIRSAEACYSSSKNAVALAKRCNTRLHILHISTARETELFDNITPLKDKKITSEACIHHLWFDDGDYVEKGAFIKWNPAIKTKDDKEVLLQAVLNNKIDVIATDHAPHTFSEKLEPYFDCPSGGPMVQHALVAMIEMHLQGKITPEKIAEKMCHAPAQCFRISNRGFIREGYAADLVIVDLNRPWTVSRSNILSKCGWSPFMKIDSKSGVKNGIKESGGQTFRSAVTHTFVNGRKVYENGIFDESVKGERLLFR